MWIALSDGSFMDGYVIASGTEWSVAIQYYP